MAIKIGETSAAMTAVPLEDQTARCLITAPATYIIALHYCLLLAERVADYALIELRRLKDSFL